MIPKKKRKSVELVSLPPEYFHGIMSEKEDSEEKSPFVMGSDFFKMGSPILPEEVKNDFDIH